MCVSIWVGLLPSKSCCACSADIQGHPSAHAQLQASYQGPFSTFVQQPAAASAMSDQQQQVQLSAEHHKHGRETQPYSGGRLQQGGRVGGHPGMQASQLHQKQGNPLDGPGAKEQTVVPKAVVSEAVLPRVTVTRGPACALPASIQH
jgi:hypothetical protein